MDCLRLSSQVDKMRDRAEANEIVLKRGWLTHTPPVFQREVLQRCRLHHFRQGDTIYSVGDRSGGMFGLIRGGLAISVARGERGPYVAHFARPGVWFGETAAITGRPPTVGLMATRDSDLLKLPARAIRKITSRDPATWRLFALAAISHIEVAIGACDDLMIRSPVNRCIAIPLRLGGRQLATPVEFVTCRDRPQPIGNR